MQEPSEEDVAEFRVLGPLEVSDRGRPLDIGGPKPRALVAVLAAAAGDVVSTDVLVDSLWGEDVPASAVNSLQTYVSRLRKLMGPETLESRAPGYVLTAAEDVDWVRFEALAESGRSKLDADPEGAVEDLRAALAMWRGRPFDGIDVPGLSPVVTRLEEARLATVEDRIEAELSLGRHGALVGELEALIEEQPWRERLWGQLMTALYRAGRQAEALRAYQRASRILGEELGIDPSPELRDLEDRILQQAPELAAPEAEPVVELSPGRSVRGYELRDRLAATDEAVVFRAYQASLGREVAVKAYRPEIANDPSFIRDFDTAARALASLEHPNMARVYDFWREPGAAYLVTTWLPQGTLAVRLSSGPLPLDRAVGVVDQIASVLAAAHRRGITHGHIDSTNVLLDDDGNASLVDFDLTSVARSLHASQRAEEEAAAQRDLAALGELARMLISPEVPAQPLPAAGHRFEEAVAVASAVRSALGMEAADAAQAPEARNPYKGLQAFTEADAGDFHGRAAMVEHLVDALGPGPRSRFLAVVGPSGSGKSSVVKAGLLPVVRTGAVPGSERWYVVDMFPGARPFAELEAALLRVAVNPPASLLDQLQSGVDGIGRAIKRVLPDPDSELLLVIDQFEELFTLADDAVASAFVDGLVDALTDERSRLRVVVTLRADFYDRPLGHPGLAAWMRERTEVVVPLTTSELEEAITGPARGVGVTVEPGLVGEMIGAVADQPGALPLLQYALTELFEGREGGPLRLDAYHEIGGVVGALARRADDLFTSLSRSAREAAQQVFLRLFALGEGTEDTRRRARVTELTALSPDRVASSEVLQCFGDYRLLSFDRDPVSRGATVEVAHEALLKSWGRLRDWVANARDDIRQQRQLATDATAWVDGGRDPSFLLTGTRLAVTKEWTQATTLALSGHERAFLDASETAAEERLAAEREQHERETALERRASRVLRTLVAVFAVATLVGASLTWFAFGERSDAQRERDRNASLVDAAETSEAEAQRQAVIAQVRSLAASAEAVAGDDPELATLLAVRAADRAATLGGAMPREVVEALHAVLAAPLPLFEIAEGANEGHVAVSSDGALVATSRRTDTRVDIWDGATGAPLFGLSDGHTLWIELLEFVPDSHTLIVYDGFNAIHIWDVDAGTRTTLPRPPEGFGPFFTVSGDGSKLFASSSNPDVQIQAFDLASGEAIAIINGLRPQFINQAYTSPAGTRTILGSADMFSPSRVLVDLGTFEQLSIDGFPPFAWGPFGARFASQDPSESRLKLHDGRSAEVVRVFEGAPSFREDGWIEFSDDGGRVAAGGSDGDVVVWDASSGQVLFAVDAHDRAVTSMDFDSTGRLVTMSEDGTTRVWDLSRPGGVEIALLRIGEPIEEARFAGPSRIVAATGVGTVESLPLPGGMGAPWSVPVVPGRDDISVNDTAGVVAIPGNDQERFTPLLYAAADGRAIELGQYPASSVPLDVVELSNGGDLITVGGGRRAPFVARLGESEPVLLTPGSRFSERGAASSLRFSPDDRYIALGRPSGALDVFDLAIGQQILVLKEHSASVNSIAFSPDGALVATASDDATIRIFTFPAGEPLLTLRGHFGRVRDAQFTLDGSRMVSVGDDRTVRVWDVASGAEILEVEAHSETISSVDVHPNGRWVLTGSRDRTARVLTLDTDELLEIARSRLPDRSFTPEECTRYGIADCPT